MIIHTPSLLLTALSRDQILADLEQMSAEDRRQVSPEWLAMIENSPPVDPWIHGFAMTLPTDAKRVGKCGFTAPPGPDGVVEIAYWVDPEFRGKGYATEAAMELTKFALKDSRVRVVRAHTLPQENTSTRILARCGFTRVGESTDHEVGVVWRWEKRSGHGKTSATP